MNIVIITFSGIPTVDYCLPLVSKDEDNKYFLVTNSLNYKKLLPDFDDTKKLMDQFKVANIDLSSFSILRIIKYFFKFNFRNYRTNNYLVKFTNKLERVLVKKLNLTIKTLKKINPDVVFFDHRDPTTIENYEKLFEYFKKNNIEVYLTPHAPHYLEENEHLPTKLNKHLLSNVTYLEAFKFSKLDKDDKNLYEETLLNSYPGFDKSWLKFLDSSTQYTDSLVVLLRPFHAKNSKWDKAEKVVMEDHELDEIIKGVNNLIKRNKYNSIIIKPHPKNFKKDLTSHVLPFIEHKNVTIYRDSIYNLISKKNQFISTYSTTLLVAIANESPTYIINSQIFNKVFKDWDVLSDLYSNFSGFSYSKDLDQLTVDVKSDKDHLYTFFNETNSKFI